MQHKQCKVFPSLCIPCEQIVRNGAICKVQARKYTYVKIKVCKNCLKICRWKRKLCKWKRKLCKHYAHKHCKSKNRIRLYFLYKHRRHYQSTSGKNAYVVHVFVYITWSCIELHCSCVHCISVMLCLLETEL